MRDQFIGYIALVLLTASISCAKKQGESSIKMEFQSKANQSLVTTQVTNIFVNISGGNEKLEVYQWNCEEQDCSNIEFITKAGVDRLIQLLVVTEDDVEGGKVNYGDAQVRLQPGDIHLPISLEEKASFDNQAEISGRYIPKLGHSLAGKRLTGDVSMSVFVGTGKPKMKLMKTEIFGGWLRLFALDTVGFFYHFTGFDQNGNFYLHHAILDDLHDSGGLDINSNGLAANTNVINHYSTSETYFQDNNGTYEEEPFAKRIVGLFGRNWPARHLCAVSTVSPSLLLDNSLDTEKMCKSVDCSDFFRWSDFTVAGDINGEVGDVCQAGAATNFPLDLKKIVDEGALTGFYGPFQPDPTAAQPYAFNHDPNTHTISWHIGSDVYLPEGVEVFFGNLPQTFIWDQIKDRMNDGLRCGLLESFGFTSHGVQAGPNGSITIPSAYRGGDGHIAICPKRPSGAYYSTAFFNQVGFGGGGGGGTPAKIHIAKVPTIDAGTAKMYNGVCYPIEVSLKDSSDYPAYSDGGVSVTLTTDGGGDFYEYPDCTTSIMAPVNVHRKRVVYYRNIDSSGSVTLGASDGSQLSGNIGFAAESAPAVNYIELLSDFERAPDLHVANTEDCVPFYVAAFSSEGELTVGNGSTFEVESITVSGGTHHYYDDEGNCESGGTTGRYNAGTSVGYVTNESLKTIWLKVPNGPTSGPSSPSISNCTGSCVNTSVQVVTPGPLDHFHADVHGPFNQGASGCYDILLGAYDAHEPNAYPVKVTSNLTYTLSAVLPGAAPVISYYDYCGGSGISPNRTMNSGTSYVKFGLQWSGAADGWGTATFSNGGDVYQADLYINP